MTEQARPAILPGGDYVIPGTADMLGVLVLALRSYRPASPRLRALADAQLAGAQEALIRSQGRAPRPGADGPRGAPSAAVVPAAQARPTSGAEMITTAEAEDLTGLSAERWRQLAVAGRIPACQTHRQVWELNRAGVIAYNERRHERGTGIGTAPGGREGEGTGTCSPGGSACGGPAAA